MQYIPSEHPVQMESAKIRENYLTFVCKDFYPLILLTSFTIDPGQYCRFPYKILRVSVKFHTYV